jgi:formiminotetrahydrofolate cyclodeaminase
MCFQKTYNIYQAQAPENSSYTQSFKNDLFELIENDISLFSENGSVIRIPVKYETK